MRRERKQRRGEEISLFLNRARVRGEEKERRNGRREKNEKKKRKRCKRLRLGGEEKEN